jgi:hypothetical protein
LKPEAAKQAVVGGIEKEAAQGHGRRGCAGLTLLNTALGEQRLA